MVLLSIKSKFQALPVVHQYVAAFDVAMQEILLVTVAEAVEKLPHYAGIVHFIEHHQTGFEEAHQIMVHVLEHQVKGTLVL